jgi:hypothetical protein
MGQTSLNGNKVRICELVWSYNIGIRHVGNTKVISVRVAWCIRQDMKPLLPE